MKCACVLGQVKKKGKLWCVVLFIMPLLCPRTQASEVVGLTSTSEILQLSKARNTVSKRGDVQQGINTESSHAAEGHVGSCGLILTVAVCGEPNVGKSSTINLLLGAHKVRFACG